MGIVLSGVVAKNTERPYDFTPPGGERLTGISRTCRVEVSRGDFVDVKVPDGFPFPRVDSEVHMEVSFGNTKPRLESIVEGK